MENGMTNWTKAITGDWDFLFFIDWFSFDRPREFKPHFQGSDEEFLVLLMSAFQKKNPRTIFYVTGEDYVDNDFGQLIRYSVGVLGVFVPVGFVNGLDPIHPRIRLVQADKIDFRYKRGRKKVVDQVFYSDGTFWQ
jgi:hypothetical protein